MEFTLAFVVFFLLVAMLLDASLYFSRRAILDQGVKSAARTLAVRNFNSGETCLDIAQEAMNVARREFETGYGIQDITFRAELEDAPYAGAGVVQPLLFLTGEWRFPCIFCTILGLKKKAISSTHRQIFQDRCIDNSQDWDCCINMTSKTTMDFVCK